MAGTKEGGRKAAITNKAKYGKDFYAKIGADGGRNGNTGGFYANRELARLAGAKGGRISTRAKTPAPLTTRRARAEFQEDFNKPGVLTQLKRRLGLSNV